MLILVMLELMVNDAQCIGDNGNLMVAMTLPVQVFEQGGGAEGRGGGSAAHRVREHLGQTPQPLRQRLVQLQHTGGHHG